MQNNDNKKNDKIDENKEENNDKNDSKIDEEKEDNKEPLVKWEPRKSRSSGKIYYFNIDTGETSWEKPN